MSTPIPLSVSLEEINRQRELGWVNFHPGDFCHRCGGRSVSSWFVDSDLFNVAMEPFLEHKYNGIICPGCFVALHEEVTGLHCTWTLIPYTPFRHVEKVEKWENTNE